MQIQIFDSSNLVNNRLLDNYISSFGQSLDINPNSRETYQRSLERFLQWITKEGIEQPDRNTILKYKSNLQERGLSAYTLSSYIVAVRRFFDYLESEGLYPNIAKNIKGVKRSRGFRKDPLTIDQVNDVLDGIETDSLQGKRDFTVINILIRTGLRTIELSRADVKDIRQESGEAVLQIQGKGRDSKDDFVLLTPASLKPLYAYLNERGVKNGDPLITSLSDRNFGKRLTTNSLSRIVKTHLRSSGIDSERITAHSLRHTAITFALLGGATIQEAQILGRHSDINTTLIYSHNINRIENAPERFIDEFLERGNYQS